MGGKNLRFDGIEINKKEFVACKQPINLGSVYFNKIVMSTKVKHDDESFKYSIGYIDSDVVKPLCIMLPQMSGGYTKCFDNGSKSMLFVINNNIMLVKYNEI